MRVVIVIARYNEDLSWIEHLPAGLEIIVVNKGSDSLCIPRNDIVVHPSINEGREAETYVRYIVENYDNLPDRIIFTQADPFEHSPFFLQLVKEYDTWQGFQPLTQQFKEYLPPEETRLEYHKTARDKRIWVDRTDCHTLNTVYYDDPDFEFFAGKYRRHYNLPNDCNLVEHLLSWSGFEADADVPLIEVNFSFGAIFSVDSEMVRKHDKRAYEKLLREFAGDNCLPYIAERCWMALFDRSKAVQESCWSLPLSQRRLARKHGPRAASADDLHPNRDFMIEKPEQVLNATNKFRHHVPNEQQQRFSNNMYVHPNRDYNIDQPQIPTVLQRVFLCSAAKELPHPNTMPVHPNRDFKINHPQIPSLDVNHESTTPVYPPRPQKLRCTSSFKPGQKIAADKTDVMSSLEESSQTELHPNRDFILLKPPTRHRYKA